MGFLQQEFPNVNPIIPTHYFYLAKRCFKALQENNGKVCLRLINMARVYEKTCSSSRQHLPKALQSDPECFKPGMLSEQRRESLKHVSIAQVTGKDL